MLVIKEGDLLVVIPHYGLNDSKLNTAIAVGSGESWIKLFYNNSTGLLIPLNRDATIVPSTWKDAIPASITIFGKIYQSLAGYLFDGKEHKLLIEDYKEKEPKHCTFRLGDTEDDPDFLIHGNESLRKFLINYLAGESPVKYLGKVLRFLNERERTMANYPCLSITMENLAKSLELWKVNRRDPEIVKLWTIHQEGSHKTVHYLGMDDLKDFTLENLNNFK